MVISNLVIFLKIKLFVDNASFNEIWSTAYMLNIKEKDVDISNLVEKLN